MRSSRTWLLLAFRVGSRARPTTTSRDDGPAVRREFVAGDTVANTTAGLPVVGGARLHVSNGRRKDVYRRNGNKVPDLGCPAPRATVDSLDRSRDSRRLRAPTGLPFWIQTFMPFGRVIRGRLQNAFETPNVSRAQNVGVRFGVLIDNLPTRFRIDRIHPGRAIRR